MLIINDKEYYQLAGVWLQIKAYNHVNGQALARVALTGEATYPLKIRCGRSTDERQDADINGTETPDRNS
jgi:hypothetical protein